MISMLYALGPAHIFPDPNLAGPEGLLAMGGDLSTGRLLTAYGQGIFPWYNEDSPILWWSPHPRLVLFPAELHVPRRLQRTMRQGRFTVGMDADFAGVIRACAATRRNYGPGTWLLPEMQEAYTRLFELGYAHSCEVRQGGELVGGIYGVALGRAFFGESMFHQASDASRVALVSLVRFLDLQGFHLMDCQQTTPHMLAWGAREIPRPEFTKRLYRAKREPALMGSWSALFDEACGRGLA